MLRNALLFLGACIDNPASAVQLCITEEEPPELFLREAFRGLNIGW
jgi:hypothetical protein